jgi:mono/diheme cytochrome c family protein
VRALRILGGSAVVTLALATSVGVLKAQAAGDSSAVRLARGKQLYEGKGLCFSCHGKEGEGVLAPGTRLAGHPFTDTKETVADVVALIKAGVDSAHSASHQIMPPRGGSRLTDAEVELVAAYVLELRKRATTP